MLKSYLGLPSRKFLNYQFESEGDYIARFASRLIKGERFEKGFITFVKEEINIVEASIFHNINNEGKDILNSFLF